MTTLICHRCNGARSCQLEIKDGLKKEYHIPRPLKIPRPSCPMITGIEITADSLKRPNYPIRCQERGKPRKAVLMRIQEGWEYAPGFGRTTA